MTQKPLIMITRESPDTAVGRCITVMAKKLALTGTPVRIICQRGFKTSLSSFTGPITVIETGTPSGDTLTAQASSFATAAKNAFDLLSDRSASAVIGFEWFAAPAMQSLSKGALKIFAVQSIERERSDMLSETSREIEKIEIGGLQNADCVLLTGSLEAAEMEQKLGLRIASKIIPADDILPIRCLGGVTDPGAVKRHHNIGPVDPVILFIGELEEKNGPDVLMKAIPAVIKRHPEARFMFIGDGEQLWPLRVHAHYLLLEYVTRIPGHLAGKDLFELIQSCDIVCLPGRERITEWPVLAAWAAGKAVVVSSEAAPAICRHESDCLVVKPDAFDLAGVLGRLLGDFTLVRKLASNGHERITNEWGWNNCAGKLATAIETRRKRAQSTRATRQQFPALLPDAPKAP